jgi:hypothetical protein
MENNQNATEPQASEDSYFMPEWLEKAREQMNRDTQGMTAEEEMAYYEARARQFRAEQAERQSVQR